MFLNGGSVHNLSLESRPARQSVCGGATHAAESFTVFSTYFLILASNILANAFSSHRPFLSMTIRSGSAG